MKKLYLFLLVMFSLDSYAEQLNCNAIYKENTIGGAVKSYEILNIKKTNNNHYDLKIKVRGSIRQKLDKFPYNSTHKLMNIICSDKEKEQQLKSLLKL